MVTSTESFSNHHSPPSAPSSSAQSGDSNSPKFPRVNLPSPWAQVVRGSEPESSAGIHQSPPPSSSSAAFSSSSAGIRQSPPPSSPSASFSPSSAATGSAEVADQIPSSDSSPKAVAATPPPVDNYCNAVAVADVATGSCDANNDGNAGRSKKPAWNRQPSNGVVEGSPVMGAESWPALSKPTKVPGKVTAATSSKTAVNGSASTSQGPVPPNTPQKHAPGHARPNTATNYNMLNRQRPVKRGGASSFGPGPAHSSYSIPPTPPSPPPFPLSQLPPVNYGNALQGIPDPSPRDHYRNNNWDPRPPVGGFVPAMNEYRGSSRRGNFGHHPHGNGSYHNSYGSRRDQDRGYYGNTRDAHVHQPRMPPRGLLRHPPPNPAPFMAPQPIGPYANNIGYSDVYYYPTVPMEHFRSVPVYTHGHSPVMFAPAVETPLNIRIVQQIEYYFSDTNLVKDDFLRSKMDEQGWVPVTLISNFPRVKQLTSNIQLILDSLGTSAVIEVQGDKLRRRNEWMRWLHSSQLRTNTSSISPGSLSSNNLAAGFQLISLGGRTKNEGSIESSSQSQLSKEAVAAVNSN